MDKEAEKAYSILVGVVLFVLGSGVVFYHFVEDLSWIDAFYFCVVTLTTVGYGDIAPKTEFGRLFTAFYILIGVGIIAAFVNAFVKHRASRFKSKHLKQK